MEKVGPSYLEDVLGNSRALRNAGIWEESK